MNYKRPLALFALIGLTVGILFTQNNVVPTVTGMTDSATQLAACDSTYDSDSAACQSNPQCQGNVNEAYADCIFGIREQPDFCSAARERARQCQYTYDPLYDFINYMNCTTASGVQYCE